MLTGAKMPKITANTNKNKQVGGLFTYHVKKVMGSTPQFQQTVLC